MSNGFKQNGKEPKDLRLVSFFTGCLKKHIGRSRIQGEFKGGNTQDLSTFFFNLQPPNVQFKIKVGGS